MVQEPEEFGNFSDVDDLLAEEEAFNLKEERATATKDDDDDDVIFLGTNTKTPTSAPNPAYAANSSKPFTISASIKRSASKAQMSISQFFQAPARAALDSRRAKALKFDGVLTPRPIAKPVTACDPSSARKVPKFKVIPGTPFAVDAFAYGPISGVSGYFLTHFHSDHYRGLGGKFFSPASSSKSRLYCSPVTANLVTKELGVGEDVLISLEVGKIYTIGEIKVGVLDANHCPGSVMFVFGVPSPSAGTWKWLLHCGDFRADSSVLLSQGLVDLESGAAVAFKALMFDTIYLDTTYANPKHVFPPQNAVISACIAACRTLLDGGGGGQGRLVPLRWLIAVGSYLIGKERIVLALAGALDCKIYADARKQQVLRCLGWRELEERLTSDPLATPLHFVSMGLLSKSKLTDYRDSFQGRFSHVLGIRPTGWSFEGSHSSGVQGGSGSRAPLSAPDIRDSAGVWPIPYSEHSSFSELIDFLGSVAFRTVVPTVDNWGDVTLDVGRWGGDHVKLLHQWAFNNNKRGH